MPYVFNGVSFQGDERITPYLMPAVADSRTIDRGLCTLETGLMGKTIRGKMNTTPVYKKMDGEFTSGGSTSTDTLVLDPIYLDVQQEFNQVQLINQWSQIALTPRSVATNFQNNDLAGAIAELMARKIKLDLDVMFWGGKKQLGTSIYTSADPFPGVIAQAKADVPASQRAALGTSITLTGVTTGGVCTGTVPATLQTGDIVTFTAATANTVTVDGELIIGQSFKVGAVSGTGFTLFNWRTGAAVTLSAALTAGTVKFINSSNFGVIYQQLLSLLPLNIGTQVDKVRVVIPWHLWQSLINNQATVTSFQSGFLNIVDNNLRGGTAMCLSYQIEAVVGAEPNTMIAYLPENLYWAVAGIGDQTSLAIIDRFPENAEKKFRYSLSFGIDAKFGFANEAALVTV